MDNLDSDLIANINSEEPEYAKYKSFNDQHQATELAELLEENGIKHVKLSNNVASFDVTFSGNTLDHLYTVSIPPSDFQRAHEIVLQEADRIIEKLPPDYYLFEFTNDELIEILHKPDEWADLDHRLSQIILKQRGQEVNLNQVSDLRKQRLDELKEPDKRQMALIIAGYCLSITGPFIELVPTFIGIFIGWFLFRSKKTLPNGERVFSYLPEDRKHGQVIFILGIALFTCIMISNFVFGYYISIFNLTYLL